MSEPVGAAPDHGVVDGAPSVPPPLAATVTAPRLSPAEEARTLVAATNVAGLATVTADGDPWASLVTYGALDNGAPVLCLSHLAEHGRNLAGDPRASLVITQGNGRPDPLAAARVTLAGRAERAIDPATLAAARTAHLAGVPAASTYVDFSDFSLWVLHVERVRWVGGYGRMDSASGAAYARAAPDPIAMSAASAITHLNDDHADALLLIAQALGGYPDATAAQCSGLDRRGIDLAVHTRLATAPAVDDSLPYAPTPGSNPERSDSRSARTRPCSTPAAQSGDGPALTGGAHRGRARGGEREDADTHPTGQWHGCGRAFRRARRLPRLTRTAA
jgi:heme oxygenase (biliverdin-IX-beta and delta-forming)